MKAFVNLTIAEFRLLMREPAAVFFTLVFPLMLLVIFGSVFGNDPENGWDGHGSMDLTVPAYFGMIIATVALLSIPVVIAEYRKQGIFRRLRATPLRPMTIIGAHAAINLLTTMIGFTLLYIGGKVLFDLMSPASWPALIFTLLLGFAAMVSLGFAITSMFTSPREAQIIGNVIYFPQLFLSGAAFPREMFSDTLQRWTKWLPMTQMIDLIKSAWLGDALPTSAIIYLAITLVVSTLVAIRTFSWE